MLVRTDGSIVGTIGGGRIELDTIDAAREVAAGGAPRRLERHLVRDLAMCCGGSMELYIEPVAPSRGAIAAALAAVQQRTPIALVTPLDGAPKHTAPLPEGMRKPRLDAERFVEPVLPPDRLVLFGGGHVARAIGPLAAAVGFEVVVCDDGEVEQGALPAWAARAVDSFELSDAERALGPLGGGDFVVILTRDHALDQRILEQLLAREREPTYLGLIGSRGKVGRFRRRIEAKGLYDAGRWARLHAPVGLDIGAETPEEIAVAIVAELVAVRNRGAAR